MGRTRTSPHLTEQRAEEMPSRIGAYSPLRLLGRGGMASVYLATGPEGEEVAVKWLARCTPMQLRRFHREVSTLSVLRHPHIVGILGSGVDQGRPYLVMEYIEGQDLRTYAAKLKLRPAAERYQETRRIGAELSEALSELHARGLIHRDLKPSNVLLRRDGGSVLADFGVVKEADEPEGAETTAAGVLVGTTGYASPEQILGGDVDHRADLYGLGCTLYFLLTGERPYPRADREEIVRAHLYGQVPRASEVDPDVPAALDALIWRLMAKKVEDRFSNAASVRSALLQALPDGRPSPLAGRRAYIDAARESLERVERGEGRVLRPTGSRGSGRRWLMEVARDLARRQGIPHLVPEDSAELHLALRRLQGGEAIAVITRLPVPDSYGVPVDEITLAPLGMADLRRTVVSVAPRTPAPHIVAEQLYRATGGHPARVVEVLARHVQDQTLVLPDPLPPPRALLDALDRLTFEAIETLGALAVLGEAVRAELLEEVVQMPVEEALEELFAEGLVARLGAEWALLGEVVGQAALERVPDLVAVHRRAAAALQASGQDQRARDHQEAAGDVPGPARMAALERMALEGRPEEARVAVEAALAQARGHHQREDEVRALRALGQIQLDLGEARQAEATLADAVALARALEMHAERRLSHVLRAIATLESRPGSHSAASAALDRLHRALTRVEVRDPDPSRALALAARAQAAAILGDRRSRELAEVAAEAELAALEPEARLRVQLRLALAAREVGARPEARARAEAVRSEAESRGWELLRQQATRLLERCDTTQS